MTLSEWFAKYPSSYRLSRGVTKIDVADPLALAELYAVSDYEAIDMQPATVTLIPQAMKWTVFVRLSEGGVLWRFFSAVTDANVFYDTQVAKGNNPTLRAYHEDDAVHYNPDYRDPRR